VGSGLASTAGLASGSIATNPRAGLGTGTGDTENINAGAAGAAGAAEAAEAGASIGGCTCCVSDDAADSIEPTESTDSAALGCAVTSSMRRSGASMRRSRQGKSKPGSPRPWPPKVRLNSNACSTREIRNARVSRMRSGRTSWRGRSLRPPGRAGPSPLGSAGSVRALPGASVAKRAPWSLRARCRRHGAVQPTARPAEPTERSSPSGHGLARPRPRLAPTASCPFASTCAADDPNHGAMHRGRPLSAVVSRVEVSDDSPDRLSSAALGAPQRPAA